MSLTPCTSRAELERLKISCLTSGVRIDESALPHLNLGSDGCLTIHEYPTTGGITLELPYDVYVNAPFDERFAEGAAAVLQSTPDGLQLRLEEATTPVVRHLPLPGYLGAVDSQGRTVTNVVMSHADRARLSPVAGCMYDCTFCDIPGLSYVLRSSEQLLAALHIAQEDRALPVRHVLISGGSPRRSHYLDFEKACVAIIEAAGVPVDIMMSPMVNNLDFIDSVVDAGVAGFAINIELYSADAALAHLGRKYRVTRGSFDAFVRRAVERLGRDGRVRSLIVPGLEPIEQTLAGVEHLASLGCWPVLSPFRPTSGIALHDHPPPTTQDLVTLLREARAIVAALGVRLGPPCLPCQHNVLAFPWDVAP